jgi:hypothetical protein
VGRRSVRRRLRVGLLAIAAIAGAGAHGVARAPAARAIAGA